jgi:NADP-dependent 3-hydroxy acid dehydrogenase YdfG
VSTILLTGSASGIGAATRDLLRGQRHSVIGVDLADAELG